MPQNADPSNNTIDTETFVQKYATALTIGIFAVVGTSGLLLFFHVGDRSLKDVHEWFGIAFVAAATVHLVRNWNGFIKLLKKRNTQVVCAIAAIGAVVLIAYSPERGAQSAARMLGGYENAHAGALAPAMRYERRGRQR